MIVSIKSLIGVSASIVGFTCCAFTASADQSVSLGWDPDPNVSGYFIYYGDASGSYSTKLDAGTNTTFTISNLKAGQTYFFAASTRDANGIESDLSSEISYIVPGLLVASPGTGPKSMQIKFPVAPTHRYEVQASQDLISWTTLWQVIASSNAWVNFVDAQTNANRFYKVISY